MTNKQKTNLFNKSINKQDKQERKLQIKLLKDDRDYYFPKESSAYAIGSDVNTPARLQWLRNQQAIDRYAHFYKLAPMFLAVYIGIHLIVALLKIIYKI